MKLYSATTTAYRAAGKTHGQVNLISFKVKAKETPYAANWYHFTSDDEDRPVSVTDPDTGTLSSRTYLGGGHIVGVDQLVRSEGTVVRNSSLVLSGASSTVIDMIYGYNCRDAVFQWFVGEIDQDTGLLVDVPVCEFVGFIDTIDGDDGALDITGSEPASTNFSVCVVSLGAALTRTNEDMRSLDVCLRRGGDRLLKHGDSAHHWVIAWGTKDGKSERDRQGGGSGKKGTGIGAQTGHDR